MSASFAYSGNWETVDDLEEPVVKMKATSPGHSVFGEYVGAHCADLVCPAPSLDNLKTSNPEDFTYVSFYESSSGGWPNDSPINRRSHIMAGPLATPHSHSRTNKPHYASRSAQAAATTTTLNTALGMHGPNIQRLPTRPDHNIRLSQQPSDHNLRGELCRPPTSVSVYVYGAITEKVGADAYDNGVKPHHNWRGWLLNPGNSGFLQITLTETIQSSIRGPNH